MIELLTTWGALVSALGSAVMLAFGAWVLTLTPRTRATKMLAVFAIAAGAVFITVNLVAFSGWHAVAIGSPLRGVGLSVGGLALLGLTREMLDPLEDRARRLWHLAVAVTAVGPLSALVAAIVQGPPSGVGPGQAPSYFLWITGTSLFFAAFLGLALVLARRYRHPPEDREEATRTQAVLVSAALVLWPAFEAGARVTLLAPTDADLPAFIPAVVVVFGGFLVVAGLWLVNARAVPERSREARNVALLTLAMLLAGMINLVFVEPQFSGPGSGPLWGLVRLATVLVLGYAILRHEVLGIEAKFRFGVSKTTVAGIFVAVFFIVSEGAQMLFAGVVGSQLLGIIAAGALLFALAPIQRLADRIAEEVVPSSEPRDVSEAETAYRRTVEKYLADGELNAEEERDLGRLAKQLDIDAERAVELRQQVEDKTEGGEAP